MLVIEAVNILESLEAALDREAVDRLMIVAACWFRCTLSIGRPIRALAGHSGTELIDCSSDAWKLVPFSCHPLPKFTDSSEH